MRDSKQLEKLPFWQILTDSQRHQIGESAGIADFKAGTLIYSHDMSCLGVIYVLKGRMRVVTISEEGREVTLFHISEGEHCVFSAACAVSQIEMETEMITEEETVLLTVSPTVYSKVMQENQELRCRTYELIIRRMSKVASVMGRMLFERMDRRLAEFLLSECESSGSSEIRKTQEAIAAELNTAREVITRILRKFSNEGAIKLQRGRIEIIDKEKLKEIGAM